MTDTSKLLTSIRDRLHSSADPLSVINDLLTNTNVAANVDRLGNDPIDALPSPGY